MGGNNGDDCASRRYSARVTCILHLQTLVSPGRMRLKGNADKVRRECCPSWVDIVTIESGGPGVGAGMETAAAPVRTRSPRELMCVGAGGVGGSQEGRRGSSNGRCRGERERNSSSRGMMARGSRGRRCGRRRGNGCS